MKLRILTLALIMFPLLLSGCWDYEEYEDLIQVTAMGIDYDKETREIKLSVGYTTTTKGAVSGSESSGSSSPSTQILHSASDKTLFEAINKLQQVLFKKLFFGYLNVVVIGEDAAKYKMLDIINHLDRTPVIRTTAFIVITSGSAEDTLSTLDAGQVAPSSEEIFNLINLSVNTGAAYPISVIRFTEFLAVPGIEATAPRVITVSKIPKPDAKGGIEEHVKYNLERMGDHRVAGLAAFRDDKFIGWLDEKESLGYGLITGQKLRAYKVSEASAKTNTEDILYYRIIRSKGRIKVKMNEDRPVFQVNVKVTADMRKYYSHQGSEFLAFKEISDMEKKLSESIHSDIEAALKRGQKELKSDIFGFGFALYRENPKLWRTKYEGKWNKVFPEMHIEINTQAKIINTGVDNRKLELK